MTGPDEGSDTTLARHVRFVESRSRVVGLRQDGASRRNIILFLVGYVFVHNLLNSFGFRWASEVLFLCGDGL